MSTKVVSATPGTTPGSNSATMVSQTDLAAQNDQLWSIISKQRNVIKDLEMALANMTRDRDSLLLLRKQTTTSSPSPTPSQEPVPPPRSPFRQHHHYHTHDGSATMTTTTVTPTTTTAVTTSTSPTLAIRHRSSSSTLGGIDSSSASSSTITSPIHAILDKDAQLFAKYQQATKRLPSATSGSASSYSTSSSSSSSTSTQSSSSPPPTNSQVVRRVLSQPHLISTATRSEQHSFFANLVIKVVDVYSQQNVNNSPTVSFIISVCNNVTATSPLISANYADGDVDDELWRIKKVYSDFVTLDNWLQTQIMALTNDDKTMVKMGPLPEISLFTTHATITKMDQRKLIEKYLNQSTRLPLPEMTDLVQFLSSGSFEQTSRSSPSTPDCQKEGYLSILGSRPGVWHSYYFMLHGSALDYYDSKGGLLIGTIQLADAQITIQRPPPSSSSSLSSVATTTTNPQQALQQPTLTITETKRFSSSPNYPHQHTLRMESEIGLDSWMQGFSTSSQSPPQSSRLTCITSSPMSSNSNLSFGGKSNGQNEQLRNRVSKDQIKALSALPICPENNNNYGKFTTTNISSTTTTAARQLIHSTTSHYQPQRSNSDTSIHPGEPKSNSSNNNSILFRGGSSDIIYRHMSSMDSMLTPASTTIEPHRHFNATLSSKRDHLRQRSSMDAIYHHQKQESDPKTQSMLSTISSSNSPTCGSSNSSDDVVATAATATATTTKKAKIRTRSNRRTFWPKKIFSHGSIGINSSGGNQNNDIGVFRGFLSRHSSDDTASSRLGNYPSPYQESNRNAKTPVFGVPLEEAVRISKISDTYELPAIVFRCIEFLENKDAIFEEGIYRLSGSAVKIKSLRSEFDEKGDVDLLASEEHQDCDIHAISGLLKLWLRELPSNVLTENLLKEFLPVIDLTNRDKCVNELGRLISMLPLANYTLLRALTAHLLRVVQNSETNKMTLRNMGIVFSPTLGIPAGIFNLFLCEFDYIFWTMEKNATIALPISPLATPTPTATANYLQQQQRQQQQQQSSIEDVPVKADDTIDKDDHDHDHDHDHTEPPPADPVSDVSDEQPQNYLGSNLYDAIHPTQVDPLPSTTVIRRQTRQWNQDASGRNNRNSVQYTDGAPECIVGIEGQCQKGMVIEDDDGVDMDTFDSNNDDDDSHNEDDDDNSDSENDHSEQANDYFNDDDMADFDDLPVHGLSQSMMESWNIAPNPIS